jgi:hippurate hydrolase
LAIFITFPGVVTVTGELMNSKFPGLKSCLKFSGILFLFTVKAIFSREIFAQDIRAAVKPDAQRLISIYKQIHANPELSFMEFETAALIASELKANGFEVYEGIGGTGVVGVLSNGDGPTVMYRADMDALAVREDTDLNYKSTVVKADRNGLEYPVAHACGHDAHVTWLIGVAKQLASSKDDWSGTVILVGQPAEELIEGAVAMVEDGLYDRVPKPDIVIAGHNDPYYPTGSVGIIGGRRLAGTDQLDVVIYGIGGHGSSPHTATDPVVMAAMATMAYQTIISRKINPYQPAVLTVGAIEAGTSNNIIPDSAKLKLNLRWYREEERELMLGSIRSITDGIAEIHGISEDRMPEYIMKGNAGPVINAEPEVARASRAMARELGQDKVLEGKPPVMISEDFQMLASPFEDVPTLFIEVGTGGPEVYTRFKGEGMHPQIQNHNPRYALDLDIIEVGTVAMTAVVREYLGK